MTNQQAQKHRESGFGHWRWQRISALVTVVLMIYFTYMVAHIGVMDFAAARAFVAMPVHAVALALLAGVGLLHAALGVQMIIEDYVTLDQGRNRLVVMTRGLFALLAMASLAAIGSVAGVF